MPTNLRNRRDNGQPKGVRIDEGSPAGEAGGHGWRPEDHWRDEEDDDYETPFKWPSGAVEVKDLDHHKKAA